jgi:transposase
MLDIPEIAGKLRTNYASEVKTYYDSILQQADLEEPQPPDKVEGKKGRPKKSPGRNLLDRLSRHKERVLAFVFKDGIPFTNNQAERDLRGVKVKQKVSGCFRTMAGAIVYARLQGVILTFSKRGENVLENLRRLFS